MASSSVSGLCMDQLVRALCKNQSCLVLSFSGMEINKLEKMLKQAIEQLRERNSRDVVEDWRGERPAPTKIESNQILWINKRYLRARLGEIKELVGPSGAVFLAHGSWDLLHELSKDEDTLEKARKVFKQVFLVQPWTKRSF